MPVSEGPRRMLPIIAIDGPVGAGKSTVAMAVAKALGFRYVDTGAMYRSVAWLALSKGVDLANAQAVADVARSLSIQFVSADGRPSILVNDTDVTETIRRPDVSEAASVISAYPAVREALVAQQRRMGEGGGVVMEGRDIGTVVFPDAEVKVFLDATPAERARRRYQEFVAKGVPVDFETLKRAEEDRDRRDTTRAHSPLRRAADATVIDTTGLSVEDIVNRIVQLVRRAKSAGRLADVLSGLWYLSWKLVMIGFFKLFTWYMIEGREHEPRRGPFIAAGNHASAADPLIIGAALRNRATYMGKAELFSVPIVGPWLRSVGVFPVRRGQPDRSAIRRALAILASGGVLVMFPEGTRSPDGRLQDPEPGAAMLALRTGAPVLPIAVVNSHRALPKGTPLPRFQRVIVRFGRPFAVPKLEGRLDHRVLEEWGRRIMAEIAALLPHDQKPHTHSR